MEKVGLVLGTFGLILLTAVIMAWPTQLLWNYSLVGAVNGVHPITFWQALGINFLFGILFKSSNSK